MLDRPIRTVDMHTGGEPVRIVLDGYPDIPGDTLLDKRRYARDHLDHLRRLLVFEPRGHADMYGVIPVEPDHADADLAVLFIHNEGYSTMCGHATIAVGRWAVDSGLVPVARPETEMVLQVPSGLLNLTVETSAERSGEVRFHGIESFAVALGHGVEVAGIGPVSVDIAFGGAFYAIIDAAALGLDLSGASLRDLVDAAWATTAAVNESGISLEHPDHPDLGFLYGTILTDGKDRWSPDPTVNLCVFADRQVDRSPTGSGVMARIATQHARGLIEVGAERTFESIIGSRFTGRALGEARVGDRDAVVVEVAGAAHYVGESTFTLEAGDTLPAFLLRP
jgi:proline racemase